VDNDPLKLYIQHLRDWKPPHAPPPALLHRWERELKLKDADIRTVHQLAITHRRKGFDYLRDSKPEFVQELREAIQLEPSDQDFLRMILGELSRYELGGENWDKLLGLLFPRYISVCPDPVKAREELQNLFPRFKFRKEKNNPILALVIGVFLAFVIGGGGLTIAWLALRGHPGTTPNLEPFSAVDWAGLNNPNWEIVAPVFRRMDLDADSYFVIQGRIVAKTSAWSKLELSATLADSQEYDLRRFPLTVVSLLDPPLLPGQSLPFRWVIPISPDSSTVRTALRVETEDFLQESRSVAKPEYPAGVALMVEELNAIDESSGGRRYAVRDFEFRNTHSNPLRRLTLSLIWKAGEKQFWEEEKTVLASRDSPLPQGLSQSVRFRLNLPAEFVPEGVVNTELVVKEEER